MCLKDCLRVTFEPPSPGPKSSGVRCKFDQVSGKADVRIRWLSVHGFGQSLKLTHYHEPRSLALHSLECQEPVGGSGLMHAIGVAHLPFVT